MKPLSEQDIARVVAEAMERTVKEAVPSERLLPFTEAELSFMRIFVARALSDLLLDRGD